MTGPWTKSGRWTSESRQEERRGHPAGAHLVERDTTREGELHRGARLVCYLNMPAWGLGWVEGAAEG